MSHSLDESEDYMHVDFSVSFKDRISRVNVYAEQVNAEQCLITKKTFLKKLNYKQCRKEKKKKTFVV